MKPHIKSIDYLRTISILAVILIHTTTRTLEVAGYDLLGFPLTLFLNQISRFAVPLFILISGFVLEISYDSNPNYFSFIKRRFGKIFIPYIFWSAIYYFLIYNQNHDNFLKVILTGNASYQLYFIPTLCIFYIIFPFLHKIYKYISKWWVLLPMGVIEILLMRHDYFIKQFTSPDPIRILILSYFFFVIGIVSARHKDEILRIVNKVKYVFLILIPGLMFYIFNEGKSRYYLTYDIKAFYSQWRPSILIYTILIGMFFFYVFNKEKYQFSFFEKISKLSFLVFFIHVIILEVVWKYIGINIFKNTFFDLLFFGVVATLSFTISYFLHKIPKIQKLIG